LFKATFWRMTMSKALTIKIELATSPRGSNFLQKTLVGLALLFTLGASIAPPAASSEMVSVPSSGVEDQTLGMQLTKVISKSGTTIVPQEFPLRTDKEGHTHTCPACVQIPKMTLK
jgi:hypothetical protein